MAATKEGDYQSHATMQSVSEPTQRIIIATTLQRLGRTNPSNQNDVGDAFSTERFMTLASDQLAAAAEKVTGRSPPKVRGKSSHNSRHSKRLAGNTRVST
jgi:hypothetical protein